LVESTARSAADPAEFGAGLAALAHAAARAGDFDRAAGIIDAIADPERRSRAWAALAGGVNAAGDHARAIELLDRAVAAAEAITDFTGRSWTFSHLANTFTRLGLADQAVEVVRSIHPTALAGVLRTQALKLARDRETDKAELVAESIADPVRRCETLCSVASATWRCGSHQRAISVIDRAEDIARSIDESASADQALRAVSLSVSGWDLEKAVDVVESIKGPERRAEVLADLARELRHDRARSGALLSRAEAETETIVDLPRRYAALISIATASVWAGDLETAEGIVDRAEAITLDRDDFERNSALGSLAQAMAWHGDTERAMDIVRSIGRPEFRDTAVRSIVTSMISKGSPDRVDALVDTIVAPGRRADVLVGLAKSALWRNDHARLAEVSRKAEVVIRDISDRRKQSTTLADLVAVAKDLDPSWTRRMVARLLSLDRWRLQAELLASVRPDLLDVIAEELAAVTGARTSVDPHG
jgi:tetratricopeptide (TPR) repeat protein